MKKKLLRARAPALACLPHTGIWVLRVVPGLPAAGKLSARHLWFSGRWDLGACVTIRGRTLRAAGKLQVLHKRCLFFATLAAEELLLNFPATRKICLDNLCQRRHGAPQNDRPSTR
jgi:hypothetical protein